MRRLLVLILVFNTLPGYCGQSFGQSFSKSFVRSANNNHYLYVNTLPTYTTVPLSRAESLNRCPNLAEHEAELKSLTRQSYKTSGIQSFKLKRKAEKLHKKLIRDCYTTVIAK